MKRLRFLSVLLSVLSISISSFAGEGESRKPFTLAILPDTQLYSLKFPDTFKSQTQWIVDNKDKQNIVFAIHLGDITQWNKDPEWETAKEAMSILDGRVPYALAIGNHDLDQEVVDGTRTTLQPNKYFPYETRSRLPEFGGAFQEGKIDNVWQTFHAGGMDWMIVTLEFGPRTCVLDWAKKVIDDHPAHKVIINTHAYMYSDDTRMQKGKGHEWLPRSYEKGPNASNNGEEMWEKLVSQCPNILLVFSGHVLNDGTGKLVSEGVKGNKVYQMLSNYQFGPKGGSGFLRLVRINPAAGRIDVKSYSPLLDEFKTEEDQQFGFENVVF